MALRFYFLIHGKRAHADAPQGAADADEAARHVVWTLCDQWGVHPRDLQPITARQIAHGA